MGFILCDVNKMEVQDLPEDVSVDFDIGDENDVEISCGRGLLSMGMWIIYPGTEYGALMEETTQNTNSTDETWKGNGLRKFLQQTIIEPPDGQDYLTVSGDAHDIMRSIMSSRFDGLFEVPNTPSGIQVGSYKFERYTDALTGFSKMLKTKNARISIEIRQGGSNERFSIILSAVPIQNLSQEIEFSEDSKINVQIKEYNRGINHLICLGSGELKNRQVIDLYIQFDGSVGSKQYYTGLNERTAIYDYSNAEDYEDLIEKGTEELEKLASYKKMTMSVQGDEMQIGDIIAGRNYETGLYMQKPIIRKIVAVSSGSMSIEYKVEGED